ALLDEHIGQGEQVLRATAAEIAGAGLDLRGTVRHLVAAMVELHARDPRLHRVLFEEAPMPRRTRRLLAESEERIAAMLEKFLAAHPEFARRDAALASQVVVQTVEALTHRLVLHGGGD